MNCILLVLSQSDVSNLPSAAARLKLLGTQNIWLLYSPAVTVSIADATKTFDQEIRDLETAKAAAVGREDYEGAKGIKTQIEGKQLDKKAAIADAWKKVSKEDRKKIAANLFRPFYEACGKDLAPIPYETEEHHEAADLHNILNLYKNVNPFGTGNYGVVFSRAIGRETTQSTITTQAIQVAQNAISNLPSQSKPEKPSFDATAKFTAQQLETLPHFSLMAVGKNRKVYVKSMPKEALIKAILDKDLATA